MQYNPFQNFIIGVKTVVMKYCETSSVALVQRSHIDLVICIVTLTLVLLIMSICNSSTCFNICQFHLVFISEGC